MKANTRKKIFAGTESIKEREYWLSRFPGEIEKTRIPYDFGNIEDSEEKKEKITFKFSEAVVSNLKRLSTGSDYTLHIILVAGVAALINRYTLLKDIIIASTIYKQEIDGEFINTVLALDTKIEAGMTFKDLLIQLKGTVTGAVENQNYPIEALLYNLELEAAGNDFPLSDIGIFLENIQDKGYFRDMDLKILFSFLRTGEHIEGSIQYENTLFKKATIERMITRLKNLFENALAGIDTEISKLDILSPEERKQLIFDFNNTKAQFERDKGYVDLFTARVRENPHKIAAVCKEQAITYRQLEHEAGCIAALLSGHGVKPGKIVGIYLDRNLKTLSSIIGIFKAGCAYLPIDMAFPPERVKYIIRNSEMEALITGTESKSPVAETGDSYTHLREIIALDNEKSNSLQLFAGGQPPSPPGISNNFDTRDLAYVIYTSGTTGHPKGVMIHQQGMINHLYAKINDLSITSNDVIAQTASISFDISVWQFLCALAVGGCTYIIDRDTVLDPASFLITLQRGAVTVLESVPSLLTTFLDVLEQEKDTELNYLRWMVPTGEALSVALVKKWFNQYPRIKLVNAYGPTEASDDITHYILDKAPPQDQETIPIGKPVQNMSIYILDENLSLCPVGVRGEICVSGIGIGKGYWKDKEKTEKAFVPNPYCEEIGDDDHSVLYKTGDVGSWREDGNIEYVGRMDNQVKIRGNRIELGEIENKILNYPGVKEAVVLVKEEDSGYKHLCAYLVFEESGLAGTEDGGISGIRGFLLKELPEYMIPSFFVPVDAMPLTPNGKVDRKALLKMDVGEEDSYMAPRNHIEEKLVEIWEKVLGRKQIGINDNFFFIGGDSIKTIQIISRLKEEGIKINMADIFDYPTIIELAPMVEKIGREADQSPVTGQIPLTPIQMDYFSYAVIEPHYFNQAVVLYAADGFDEEAVRAVFDRITRHHDALRMTYREENGNIVQECRGLEYPLSLDVFDLRRYDDQKEELEKKAGIIQASIDLENGPLMKLGLFRLSDGDRLLIAIHHLAVDGVSWRILFEDIDRLYMQYRQGEQFKLPLKSDSFKLWSEQLSKHADSELFLEETDYWSKLEAQHIPEIEKDFTQGDNYLKDVLSLSFKLTEEETRLLLSRVNEPFNTEITDILLTSLGLGINKTFAVDKVLIDLESHGRDEIIEDVDISRTVGWFTSIYPVLLNLSPENELSRQIKEIKETLHQVPNSGLGYGVLENLTAPANRKGYTPSLKPRIIFNYLGQFDMDLERMAIGFAEEPGGIPISSKRPRKYEFEITGMVVKNCLKMSVDFSTKQYREETVKKLVDNYRDQLKALITFCDNYKKKEITPSDMDYKDLSLDELDTLFD